MLSSHKHTILTAALALALGAPFALRLVSATLEPYPAVLLPSSATLLHMDDGAYAYTATELYAREPDSREWALLDNRALLAPVPAHYLGPIVGAGFGLEPRPTRAHFLNHFRRLGLFLHRPFDKISPEDIDETKRWLRAKLRALGLEESQLRIVNRKIRRSAADGSTLESVLVNERAYELD